MSRAKMSVTLKDLVEGIWRIEKHLDLLTRQIHGLYYWPLIRGSVVHDLSCQARVHASVQPRSRRSLPGRLAAEALTAAGFAGPPWRLPIGAFDTVLIPVNRKIEIEGRTIDVDTERILHDRSFGRVLMLDRMRKAVGPADARFNYEGLRALVLARASAVTPTFLWAAAAERRILDSALQHEFAMACPLSAAEIAARLGFFSQGRHIMRAALRATGAKTIIVSGHHVNDGVIAAASDLGMLTAEMQHGFISPYHTGYHFPGHPRVPYMADRFLVFGEYWAQNIELPANTKAVVIGSHRFSAVAATPTRRIPRRVVVVSQGTIGPRLFNACVQASSLAPDWGFVFRPHPAEDLAGYARQLASLSPPATNLRLSEQSENLLDLLRTAETQVGVYSTALFEGMVLGVRTIVLALPGWEGVAAAIEEGDAVVAQNASEIAALLAVAPTSQHPEKYFAVPAASIASALELVS